MASALTEFGMSTSVVDGSDGIGAVSSSSDDGVAGPAAAAAAAAPTAGDSTLPTAEVVNFNVTGDGVILYTDYDDVKHEILPSSTFLVNLSPGLISYLASRDRKARRGRKPQSASDDEDEMESSTVFVKPGPLSKKQPTYFSPALSKLTKKSGKKNAGSLFKASTRVSPYASRGEGKRKRKAPSWMMQDDFVVDRETVDSTKIPPPVVKRPKVEEELDDIQVVKDRIGGDDEMQNEEADEVKHKDDVLGFKSWISDQSNKDVVVSDTVLGKPGDTPTKALKDKISKPFACAVCQDAFSQPMELQEHIKNMHESPTVKRKPYVEDEQTVKCDKCSGWFSPRGIERHKTMAHGNRPERRGMAVVGAEREPSAAAAAGGAAQKVEATSTTPGGEAAAVAGQAAAQAVPGTATQCHLCSFRAVRPEQLTKHLKYTHKVQTAAQGKDGEAAAGTGGGGGSAGGAAAQQPVIDIRPDGNKIYIECHGLNLQPEDAARICAEVMTIPDNAEIIIVK